MELIPFCQSKGIFVTVYHPFGAPNWPWSEPEDVSLFDDPQVKEIALMHSKIAARANTDLGTYLAPDSKTHESNSQIYHSTLHEGKY